MDKAAIDTWAPRSRAVDLAGIRWDDLRSNPLRATTLRTLRYMQDIESQTVVYVRQLLATRAIDDPDVATFLACWFYEETFHGRALERVLTAGGHAPVVRRRSRQTWSARLQERALRGVSCLWPEFVAVMRDESRHFAFYYHQAERRLASRGARRIARALVDRFWAPVGSGVQPDAEVRFLARYLFGDRDGHAAARRIDGTIRRLRGFEDVALVEAWVDGAMRTDDAIPALRQGATTVAGAASCSIRQAGA